MPLTLIPTTCPGPCNNAFRAAEEARSATGAEHHITPAWGEPVQCYGCVERTRGQLWDLPALLTAVLAEAVDGTQNHLSGTIGRAAVATWPGQASRILVDRIVGEMAELGTDILVQRGIWASDAIPGPGTTPDEENRIKRLVTGLDAHWDWAMQHHPAATEPHSRGNANPGAQATSWYLATRYFTKDHEQHDVEKLAPCPKCRGPWLYESRTMRLANDHPYIACRTPGCPVVMLKSEYDAYVKDMRKALQAGARPFKNTNIAA